jgi:very-short-patch-repair endonuclease
VVNTPAVELASATEPERATEPIAAYVHAHGGVVRTRKLIRAGYSRHRIDRALAGGSLIRVRKGWVSAPGADPYLVAAARAGVVLSCVTQARRLGLWVLHEDRPHVAAPAHSGCATPRNATVHWAKPVVPRHPDALTDPVENVLVLVALCQPFEPALAVWESALRQRLVDQQALRRMPLPSAARNLLESASPFSDSGLESFILPRLGWLKVPIVPQVWISGHRVDFLIGERLVLQVDGGHHVGEQRESDVEHDAQLMLLGYHVIRVGYGQIVNRWQTVQDLIMRAVAQGLHLVR